MTPFLDHTIENLGSCCLCQSSELTQRVFCFFFTPACPQANKNNFFKANLPVLDL